MKARLPAGARLTNKQRAEIDALVREEVKKHFRKEADNDTRRVLKLVCVALNNKFGFGKERCSRLLEEITRMAIEDDPCKWTHIDKRLAEMGVVFAEEDWREFS